MQVIDFLIAATESAADIHWSIEGVPAVLMHLPQALFPTDLEKIWIFVWWSATPWLCLIFLVTLFC